MSAAKVQPNAPIVTSPWGGVIGVLVGIVVTWVLMASAVNGQHHHMMKLLGLQPNAKQPNQSHRVAQTQDMTMSQMAASLQGKTGAELDKAFLQGMIMHHQGAIEMSKLVQDNSEHDEIKQMANDIITKQAEEIDQMKNWQQQWGFDSTAAGHSHADHSD